MHNYDPELVKETERFEFRWFGKSGAKRNAFTPSKATLVYDEKRSVNPDDADGNMIIEGENLETLKVLLSAYRERIKCIYIDPPYNTGKDFVYSDRWDESKEDYWEHIGITQDGVKVDTNTDSDGRYHSKWLNMMYPRLLLARQLLRDDGVIFISIDDNEVHHLKKLCDEVLGEENFISNFVWKKRTGSNDAKNFYISADHEYILTYAKSATFTFYGIKKNLSNYSNPDNDPRGAWARDNLTCNKTASERPNLFYPIIDPTTNIAYECNPNRVWVYEKNRMYKLIQEEKVIFPKDGKGTPVYKRHLSELRSDSKPLSTWIKQSSENSNSYDDENNSLNLRFPLNFVATKYLRELMSGQYFDYPKSHQMIFEIIKQATDDNDIILDFFAGSGTTAHAVMELNKEDVGNRKFIMIQIPELIDENSEAYKAGYKKISDITIERNKRAIQKFEESEKQRNFDQAFKTGFKVYKLAKSNFPRVEFAPDPDKTEEENFVLLDEYIEEKEAAFNTLFNEKDIFDEVLLKNGFMLNYKLEQIDDFTKNKVFRAKDGFKECFICMEMNIAKETLKELEKYKDQTNFICLERSLDTTMKWNLRHLLGDKLIAV